MALRLDVRSLHLSPYRLQPRQGWPHLLLEASSCAVFTFFRLRRGRGDSLRMTFLGVYAFTCVLLLSLSGVYHLLAPGGAGRTVLRRLDHGAIFALIAGTYTPVHGILFRGRARWTTLLLI